MIAIAGISAPLSRIQCGAFLVQDMSTQEAGHFPAVIEIVCPEHRHAALIHASQRDLVEQFGTGQPP
jgi:hypothetical protein